MGMTATTTNPYKASGRALRRMRQQIFSYPDSQEARADRVLAYLVRRVCRGRAIERAQAPRGPYSGLTRSELAASGTCETDWY